MSYRFFIFQVLRRDTGTSISSFTHAYAEVRAIGIKP